MAWSSGGCLACSLRRVISVHLAPYDPAWSDQFAELAAPLRQALGDRALRIDHIGSTAVPGIAAKPIVDVQVAVDDFEPFPPLRAAIESVGYRFWPDNDDLRKRYFTLDRDGGRVSNLHCRRWGEFSAQAALLLRDHLRAVPAARQRYEATKRELATRAWPTVDHYADAKGDTIWALLREADEWGWALGWHPGPSDA